MRVLGIKCAKDELQWALVDGEDRDSAIVATAHRVSIPGSNRGEQLVRVRKEILDLLRRESVGMVAIRAAEPSGQGNSLLRAEVEGVVQEAVASTGLPYKRLVAASLRSQFAAKNGAQLDEQTEMIAAVLSTPKTRRDPVVAAVALME